MRLPPFAAELPAAACPVIVVCEPAPDVFVGRLIVMSASTPSVYEVPAATTAPSLATFRMSVPSVSSNIRKFGVVAVEVISALLMYRWSAV